MARSVIVVLACCNVLALGVVALGWARKSHDERVLRLGKAAPPIIAKDLRGQAVTLTFDRDDPPTVLYFFSPKCTLCTANIASVTALHTALPPVWRFVGVSTIDSGLDPYLAVHKITFPVITAIRDEARRYYFVGITPETIVVRNGTIARNWVGTYGGRTQHEIERYFGLRLPMVAQ